MNNILEEIKNHNPNKGKVLINTHSNLNYQAGDVIYISNLINILIRQNIKVLLTSKYDIGENFMRNIENKKLLESKKINFNELDNFIDKKESELSLIIIRNHNMLDRLKNQQWLKKTILYGLDIHLEGIKKIENYKKVWVQSEDIKKQYIENGIKEEKLKVIEPLVYKYDFNLPERDDNEIHLIYAGTLRNEENILEIIEEFKKIHRERPEVKLKIVYGKIMGNKDFQNKIQKYIEEGIEGCKFKYNLSHRETCYEIATSDIGICWRKKGWGENGEISTKVKEYELYGLQIVSNFEKLSNKKYIIKDKKVIINNIYHFNTDDNFLLDKILNNKETFKQNQIINVKFNDNFQTLFTNEKLSKNFKYDFTYETLKSNTYNKIRLYKNVFYKINCSDIETRVKLYEDLKDKNDIFRNCLHNINEKKNIYFTIQNSGIYYLFLKQNNINFIKIENLISINYLCGDNVYILNLDSQKNKFNLQNFILNKFGIKAKRLSAVDGKDKKYDTLWNNYLNLPLNDIEKKINRRLLTRGSLGYLLSMEKIFSNIDSNYVCIFDDDILINKSFSLEELSRILVKLSNFNILKLGSSQWVFDNIEYGDEYYYPSELSNGSFACIYNKNTYKKILEKIRLFNSPFDFEPMRQFYNNKTYVIYPNLMIANLDDISTISNKSRTNDYKRFRWNIDNYIKLPYFLKKKYLINNENEKNKTHFYIGITTFNRTDCLKKTIESIIKTLSNDYFFTIFISRGLELLEKEDIHLESYLKKKFENLNNVNLLINYSYFHYIYYTSNYILQHSRNINYDFGFIINDDIILKNDWYVQYYNISKKYNIEHLCWLKDNNNTIVSNELKHNGSVLNANGVLLTFNSNVLNKVGLFNDIDFKVRGQSHIEWSLWCCIKGFNNKNTFFDISNSNELVKLNNEFYKSAIQSSTYLDKVIYFVDKYELERRNDLLMKLFKYDYN